MKLKNKTQQLKANSNDDNRDPTALNGATFFSISKHSLFALKRCVYVNQKLLN